MTPARDFLPSSYRLLNPSPIEFARLVPTLLAHLPEPERQRKLWELVPPPASENVAGRTSLHPPAADTNAADPPRTIEAVPPRSSTTELPAGCRRADYRTGLFLARQTDRSTPVAMIWAHPAPGQTAIVGPAQTLVDSPGGWQLDERPVPPSLQVALLQQAVRWAAEVGVEMLQAVTTPDSDGDVYRLAGMEKLADLIFLSSPLLEPLPADPSRPNSPAVEESPGKGLPSLPTTVWELEAVPPTELNRPRWYRLLEETYRDSLDCPTINGRRSLRHTVDGYRDSGGYCEQGWVIVRAQAAGAGRGLSEVAVGPERAEDRACFILADHEASDFVELIYFGVAPPARGGGLGRHLLAQAEQIARQMGRSRLIAAVDRQNLPALRVYAAGGYQVLEEKTVFARFFPGETSVLDPLP